MSSKASFSGKSPEEFVRQLKELVAANVAGNAQLVTRFNEFIRDAAKAVGTGGAGEPRDAGALLTRWLDFNLAAYSVVSTNGLRLLNGLVSAAESTLIPKSPPPPEARRTPEPRVELQLSGRPGERVTSGFVVENHFDNPLAVTVECGELVPATGRSLPASLVTFERATLVIAPREKEVIRAAVAITSDFVVGQTYTTTIRLLGFQGKEVALSITVLPPAEAAKPSARAPRRIKRGEKRRPRSSK
jgi:hypothetical protein